MRIFGIDPGSDRTGYGCVEAPESRQRENRSRQRENGSRQRENGSRRQASGLCIVTCGAITTPALAAFPEKLLAIHTRLTALIAECQPDCVAVENLFFATNVRSALKLGHARGVAILAAVEAGLPVAEYTPAEIKRAVVGYGRAEKHQVQQMVKLILGLATLPVPHDAADALAVAICHLHSQTPAAVVGSLPALRQGSGQAPSHTKAATSWRHYRPAR